jgi:3-hydroxy-5-methyl-1-naphthoate 3-O-methyltransferase
VPDERGKLDPPGHTDLPLSGGSGKKGTMDAPGRANAQEVTLIPGEIRQMLRAYMGSRALLSGLELGVFDALADDGPLALAVLARRLALPPSSLQRLLTYLCARGLLEKRGAGYANSSAADTYLVSDRPAFLAGDAPLVQDLYLLYTFLSDAIREDSNRWPRAFPGRDQDAFAAVHRDPATLRGFLAAMALATKPIAAELCDIFDFGAARCLLDIGGASALLATTVFEAYPHLRGTTLDLPVVAPFAREAVAVAGLADRLAVASGDMFGDHLPSGADVITLSWILHDWDDERALALLRRCHAVLEPGGAILVLEALLDEDGTGPIAAAELSLTMLVATQGGRERTAAEYGALLGEARFARWEVRRMQNAQERHCIVGWKD